MKKSNLNLKNNLMTYLAAKSATLPDLPPKNWSRFKVSMISSGHRKGGQDER
jgi:hypothetical protein